MENNYVILFLCGLVMLSYVFNIVSKYSKIPSVILLLATGIGLRAVADSYGTSLNGINNYVQILGTVGLIMIVLEASLDLHLTRDKVPLIKNSLLSAITILAFSILAIAAILYYWMQEPFLNSVVYAIPLSIISSSIIIPSVTHMNEQRKEFLVYEASFSDIIGILVFNFFTMQHSISLGTGVTFFVSIVISILISFVFSLLLIYLLSRISINVKFFLVFSILIFLYVSGKMFHLPSLIIIMIFGLLVNNWRIFKTIIPLRLTLLESKNIEQINTQLTSITAESAFLIRTFFFVAFGYSIDLHALFNTEVVVVGLMIVGVLLLARLLLLKLFIKTSIFPEILMVPRGLITILLFYIIPQELRLQNFNEGILSFVVVTTSVLMMIGLVLHKPEKEETGDMTAIDHSA